MESCNPLRLWSWLQYFGFTDRGWMVQPMLFFIGLYIRGLNWGGLICFQYKCRMEYFGATPLLKCLDHFCFWHTVTWDENLRKQPILLKIIHFKNSTWFLKLIPKPIVHWLRLNADRYCLANRVRLVENRQKNNDNYHLKLETHKFSWLVHWGIRNVAHHHETNRT